MSQITLWNALNRDIPHTPRFPKISKQAILIGLSTAAAATVITMSPPAKAQLVIADEVDKVAAIAAMLENMVSSMTNVLAGSGGASAAFQVFRRIILNNL